MKTFYEKIIFSRNLLIIAVEGVVVVVVPFVVEISVVVVVVVVKELVSEI